MKRCFVAMCLAALALTAAPAQQKKTVPPPPKPADGGPSLEVTMKFIQDKLNGVGPVNYVVYYHDNAVGDHWTFKFRDQAMNVVAYPVKCHITYHWKSERNGEVTHDADAGFELKSVEDVVVKPMEQGLKKSATAQGHPSWSFKLDPPVYALEVHRTDQGTNGFVFFDEQLGNRVAKAMAHAAELCGGGSKPF